MRLRAPRTGSEGVRGQSLPRNSRKTAAPPALPPAALTSVLIVCSPGQLVCERGLPARCRCAVYQLRLGAAASAPPRGAGPHASKRGDLLKDSVSECLWPRRMLCAPDFSVKQSSVYSLLHSGQQEAL